MNVVEFDSYRDGGTCVVVTCNSDNEQKTTYFIHGTCRGNDRVDVTRAAREDSTPSSESNEPVGVDEVKDILNAVLRVGITNYRSAIFNAYAYHYRLVRALLIAAKLCDENVTKEH